MLTVHDLEQLPEWEHYPNAVVLRTDGADEGAGHGFDNLDPSAYVRAYARSEASWADIAEWYRERLGSLGWGIREQPDSLWFSRNPHEAIVIGDCSRGTSRWDTTKRWIPNPAAGVRGTVFSIYFKRSSSGSKRGQPEPIDR